MRSIKTWFVTVGLGVLAFQASSRVASAQGDVLRIPAPSKVAVICAYPPGDAPSLRFGDLQPPRLDAQIVVSNMLQALGVKKNLQVFTGPVRGLASVSIDGQAAIVFNPAFLRSAYDRSGKNPWSVISLLAHQLGHSATPEAIRDAGSTPRDDPKADYLSGWMMHRLGASLEDSLPGDPKDGSGDRKGAEARARQVTEGYRSFVASSPGEPAPSFAIPNGDRGAEPTRPASGKVACTHKLPCTHDVPCGHHLACRHRVACVHAGAGAHKFDPAHPFDLEHVADPEHPFDTEHESDPGSSPQPDKPRPFVPDVSALLQKS